MQYIGSLYAPDLSSAEFRSIALSQLKLVNLPQNGFSVQTLLLLAIAVHAEDEREKARAILDRNICMALELGMNHRAFAEMERDLVLAESWRRTFWGLYVLDGVFSGIACASSFMWVLLRRNTTASDYILTYSSLSAIETQVDLPCEDYEYESGVSHSTCLTSSVTVVTIENSELFLEHSATSHSLRLWLPWFWRRDPGILLFYIPHWPCPHHWYNS